MATGAKMRTSIFRKLVLSNIQMISVLVYCGDYVFLHKNKDTGQVGNLPEYSVSACLIPNTIKL